MTLSALLMAGGCFVEYVLPEGSTGETSTGEGAVTDATMTMTGTQTTEPTSGDGCEPGLSPCGEACVDLTRDDAHCGACGEYCKVDERCIASECRDIFVVDCAACPCDACPDGMLDPTDGTDGTDGSDPQKSMCCPPAGGSDAVVCVIADADDPDEVLVCPA